MRYKTYVRVMCGIMNSVRLHVFPAFAFLSYSIAKVTHTNCQYDMNLMLMND